MRFWNKTDQVQNRSVALLSPSLSARYPPASGHTIPNRSEEAVIAPNARGRCTTSVRQVETYARKDRKLMKLITYGMRKPRMQGSAILTTPMRWCNSCCRTAVNLIPRTNCRRAQIDTYSRALRSFLNRPIPDLAIAYFCSQFPLQRLGLLFDHFQN